MKTTILTLFLLSACGMAMPAPDVRDVPVATDTGCVMETNVSACRRSLTAICDRMTMCCSAVGVSCGPNFLTVDACRGYLVSRGFDCSAAVDGMTCTSNADACADTVRLISCSDWTGGTAATPRSCQMF